MNRAVSFRRANADDLAAIIGLLADDDLGHGRETISGPPAPEYRGAFAAIDASPDLLLAVGELDGRVVATLQMSFVPGLSRRGSRRATLEAVRVASAVRGNGIGHDLVRWAVERAKEQDCQIVQLTTDRRRVDAQRFYQSLGFEPTHIGMKLQLS